MKADQINTASDALVTEERAAELLALSVRTLQAWRLRGAGPAFVRAGAAVRYQRSRLPNGLPRTLSADERNEKWTPLTKISILRPCGRSDQPASKRGSSKRANSARNLTRLSMRVQ